MGANSGGRSDAMAAPPAYATNENGHTSHQPQPSKDIDITASFANLSLGDSIPKWEPDNPSCIVHLKLLHAIHALKEDVGYTDGLFGLYDSVAIGNADKLALDAIKAKEGAKSEDQERLKLALSKIREKRWALYVARAVDRYEAWWKSVQTSTWLTEAAMEREASELYVRFPTESLTLSVWKEDALPPLDVLMVLHSHMLNPRAFLEDAMRVSLKWLWESGMPWHLINRAIDTCFEYNVSEACQKRWTQNTGRSWSNVDDAPTKVVNCPHCLVPNHIPWTTCKDSANTQTEDGLPDLVGSGYGDGKLGHQCVACDAIICKEALSVRKFVQDVAILLTRSIPMPGTMLDPQTGMPEVIRPPNVPQTLPRTFPNRMLKLDLRIQVQEIFNAHRNPTMETVKEMVEAVIKDARRLCVINSIEPRVRTRYTIAPKAKVCVRKMMSRYWENFSPFALDLCGAVMRQGVFIDKMVKLDWLHSPSTSETVQRLIGKYINFMKLMQQYPRKVAVPTLDVDLAWHTHQLSPVAYYAYTTTKMHRFIDHDDKIEETKLNEAFAWTSKTYQECFHAVYSECTCWYCESVRASHTSKIGSIIGSSRGDKHLEDFYRSGKANLCPPNNSAHISAHNAVRSVSANGKTSFVDHLRRRQEAKLEENYLKACKRAEKKGRKLPPRNEYYDHWGYAYFMYSPAMYPMYYAPGMYYGWDPCYTSTGTGAWGACVAGSCSAGGIAVGSCGNAGGCSAGGVCGSSGGDGGGAGCGGGGGGGGCGGGGGGGCGGGGGGS